MPRWLHRLLLAIGVTVLVIAFALLGFQVWTGITARQTADAQATLDPFYLSPDALPGPPGTLIRTEPLDVEVPGATALRMLYVTERPDGSPAISGGTVFIPDTPAPAGGRGVVAWAHPTVGMADSCAPSRSANPLRDTENWLNQMMELGWVVTATDYAGLGTAGPDLYLVGQAEARDVVNSVRALKQIPNADPGPRFAVWGHSQGGHSSLWTGQLAKDLAPDLDLVGVAAAAPAARLQDRIRPGQHHLVRSALGDEDRGVQQRLDRRLVLHDGAPGRHVDRIGGEELLPFQAEGTDVQHQTDVPDADVRDLAVVPHAGVGQH